MKIPRRYRFIARRLERLVAGRVVTAFIAEHGRLFRTIEIILVAFVVAMLLQAFVVQSYRIPSASMDPTLKVGDVILVSRLTYLFREPRVGDIAVFRPPDMVYSRKTPVYIKRVAAPPDGVVLDIVHEAGDLPQFGHIYLDGERVNDAPFIADHAYAMFVHVKDATPYVKFERSWVPEGEIFVLGDNTLESADSRIWGSIPVENLEGRAFFRVWPPKRFGRVE